MKILRPRVQSAFTLTELLVVIAIIAITNSNANGFLSIVRLHV